MYVDNSDIERALTGVDKNEPLSAGITIKNIKIQMSESIAHYSSLQLSDVSLLITADQLIKKCKSKLQKQNKLSDKTLVGGKPWSKLKDTAMMHNMTQIGNTFWYKIKKDAMDNNYEEKAWFVSLRFRLNSDFIVLFLILVRASTRKNWTYSRLRRYESR